MPKDTWGEAEYVVTPSEDEPFHVTVSGRERWAFEALIAAGQAGCAPIDSPASRWAEHVLCLRKLQIEIETVRESHKGSIGGTRARYVLRSAVRRVSEVAK